MKRLILVTSVSLLLAGTAMAADAVAVYEEPAAPVLYAPSFTWTGPYVGLHIGYAWGNSDFVDIDGWNVTDETFGFKPNGVFGGAQAGYNWQFGNAVIGAEAEIGYLNIEGSAAQPSSFDTVASTTGGVYAGLSARLGYAIDRTLIYAKAGGVYSAGDYEINDACAVGNCGPGLLAGTETIGLGYQLGAGIEHAFTDNWTAKIEYSYFDFGSRTINALDQNANLFRYDADLSAHTVKIGLNYKF